MVLAQNSVTITPWIDKPTHVYIFGTYFPSGADTHPWLRMTAKNLFYKDPNYLIPTSLYVTWQYFYKKEKIKNNNSKIKALIEESEKLRKKVSWSFDVFVNIRVQLFFSVQANWFIFCCSIRLYSCQLFLSWEFWFQWRKACGSINRYYL